MSKNIIENGLEVAVVGLSLRLPACVDAATFWQNLSEGNELIKFFSEEQLRSYGVSESLLQQENYVKAGAFLDEPFQFDAEFFNYVPREAEFMDPQLRLLHECSWQALQDAGCNPHTTDQAVGMYCGSAQNINWLRQVSNHVGDGVGEVYDLKMLYQREFFNTRVAYNLNFNGPSLTIDSTCSTSLVAIHLAAQGLLSGDCDVALAGGVCVSPLTKGYSYHKGMIQSADGHCRTFDAQANGTVPGNGIGLVALKRLEDAIADGNHIYGVLKGSAINNDGSAKPGYTAPSVKGQKQVINLATDNAEVDPDSIDFIECHGTATKIGDPIEVQALQQAYGDKGDQCLIGSVKSNVGHLDAAAGVIGFIKAIMSVHHKSLPASLHFTQLNENINFSDSKFAVNDTLRQLDNEHRPLRGAVSSFGIGGTNAHVIVEEYIEQRSFNYDARRYEMFPISAKTDYSAQANYDALANWQPHSERLADLAYSVQVRDSQFTYRRSFIAQSLDQLKQATCSVQPGWSFNGDGQKLNKLAFMFPGQGGQYLNMAADLYQYEQSFKDIVDACFSLLTVEQSSYWKTLLFSQDPTDSELLTSTDNAQPLLFIIEYSLARYLMDLGVKPDYLIGHSLGEYVAACLAGVFSLEDALTLVIARGQLMAQAPVGAMLSIASEFTHVKPLLHDELELAASNSASLYVVAGSEEAIVDAQAKCEQMGIKSTRLHTSKAYHCYLMNEVLPKFRTQVEQMTLHAPQLPFFSNLSGELIRQDEATDPEYWVTHLRGAVNFASAVGNLFAAGVSHFVEVGPGNALSTFVRSHEHANNVLVMNTLRHPKEPIDDDLVLHQVLSRLYCSGVNLDWSRYNQHRQPKMVAVPAYQFQPTKYAQVMGQTSNTEVAQKKSAKASIEHARPNLSSAMLAPRNEQEQAMAQFWKSIFTLSEVGVNDNFFELGGHSLLATRVLNFISEAFDADLQIADVFETPTIAGLVEKAQTQEKSTDNAHRIQVIDRNQLVPASFQQRRLWLIDQLEGSSSQYNMPASFILHGALDREALQQSINALVVRHEVLRTNFEEVDGEAFLKVNPVCDIPIDFKDLSHLDKQQQALSVREIADSDAIKPFDLAQDPMIRLSVLRLKADSHMLAFNVHHIVSDGWSEMILVRDFQAFYLGFAKAQTVALPELDLQYIDYAYWQRNWLQGEQLEAELSHWESRLTGAPVVHNLPLDRPRATRQTFNGDKFQRKITQAHLHVLKDIARQEGVTLFMMLETILSLVVGRWSGQQDIMIGTPIAGRNDKRLEPLLGFFVNTLVLRNNLSGNPSFKELLGRTREVALDAFAHPHVPFDMVVERVCPQVGNSHSPLFQILFALQNYERTTLSLGELEFEKVEQKVSAKCDLSLLTAEVEDGLLADWYFNTDLFDAQTITKMADHFELAIAGLCEVNGDFANINELPMVTADEYQWMLPLAQTEVVASKHTLIHQMFDWQATQTPSAIAMVFEEQRMTYAQLQHDTDAVAAQLQGQGIGQGDSVAIMLPRGKDMIVALLGIQKAGAAYIPIDPSYPQSRVQHMLDDSGAKVVVSDSRIVAYPSTTEVLDLAQFDPSQAQLLDYQCHATAQDTAYIIYTSGTSGLPKGVAVSHGALLTAMTSRIEELGSLGSVLLLNSISFDASILSIFWSLATGGKLVIASDAQVKDPEALTNAIDEHFIESVITVPSIYRAVLDLSTHFEHASSLKLVILGGEALTHDLRRLHFNCAWSKQAQLHNEYGPTEATISSTYFRCDPTNQAQSTPIGKAWKHVGVAVLNDAGALVPQGCVGELCIFGPSLAQGYWQRPDLTEQKFVQCHAFSIQPERVYRTGDLVYWNQDQELEFIGRIDQQIKLRGYRIEQSEIESVITAVEGVEQAVVQVKQDKLIGYVHASDGVTEGQLEQVCSSQLPDYMVPQCWVFMAHFPLTPVGKIDLKQLPEPDFNKQVSEQDKASTELECLLHGIWSQLLNLDEISIHDSFFKLGGDSILILKLKSHLGGLGWTFDVPQFYAAPTIAQLARILANKTQLSEQKTITGAQLLMPAQHWLLQPDAVDVHHFNQALMLKGQVHLDHTTISTIVSALVTRHDALRLSFKQDDNGYQANYLSLQGGVAQMVEYYQTISHADIEPLAAQAQAALSLEGPLFKAVYMGLEDGSCRLLLVANHLVVDGVSWRILLADLMKGYEQLTENGKITLSAKTTSLQSWSKGLQALAKSEVVQQELSYWQSELAKPFTVIEHQHIEQDLVADEQVVSVPFDEAITNALLTQGQSSYGMGIEELLLAAISEAMNRWQGMSATRIILENHGRDIAIKDADVSDTVGWFTAMYPLHLEHYGDIRTHLLATKKQCRAVPAKGAHFSLLQYLSSSLLKESLPDTKESLVFNYLGQFDQSVNANSAFTVATEKVGDMISLSRPRDALLCLDGMISGGCLKFTLRYGSQIFDAQSMALLAEHFQNAVIEFAQHCKAQKQSHRDVADFELVTLTPSELEQICDLHPNLIDVYPCTPSQRGMLLHTQLMNTTQDTAYCNQLELDLVGNLDFSRFAFAWQQVGKHNAVFSTAFFQLAEQGYVQAVFDGVELPVTLHDGQALGAQQSENAYLQLRHEDKQRGFALDQPCMARVQVWQFAADRFRVLITMHHAIIDGWSLPSCIGDVMKAYYQGEISSRPTFKSYIQWLMRQESAAAEAFWQTELQHVEQPTTLVGDLYSEQPSAADKFEYVMDTQQLQSLERCCKQQGVTLSTLVQGAWAYLLHRYTGQDNVVFGTTISGRPADLSGSGQIIGPLINTIPVSVDCSTEQTISDWLLALHTGAAQREHFGFLDLPALKKMTPITRLDAMFNTLVVVENYPLDELKKSKEQASQLRVEKTHADESTNFDITLMVLPGTQLKLHFVYQSGLFSASKMAELAQALVSILSNLAESSAQVLATADLLEQAQDEQEVEQMLGELSDAQLQSLLNEIE
ncbi:D-alanine--D-alanyl carrier protein ligase [Pseudoalteromonas holothuriae]|uniref:D-alanine--D-alanyl carrier protein ligase n=1 Tax=Pseudoalteromonas holothuriae TaxID=2963714 RepID=A0ABN8UNI9_9GAMM|nr:non-ribosomal peptide synthetase/type I polyketide synthase [Pseudoalteromonas sp. CIP111951]CAH9063369.1 D-alanine--D-alanyl carrier protein ligase [Pseudoalteromonas sp. CIP111951]